MSRIKNISTLLNEMKHRDREYGEKIQFHWIETDRLYRDRRYIEHFTKLHVLYVNEVACRSLLHQAIVKELNNDNLDRGKAHE